MRMGYAKKDITPPVGIRLGGYGHRVGRPSQTVHDPLLASAIHIESHNEDVLLIHCDVLGVHRSFADEVKNAISTKLGIDSSRIFFTTTHTHSGPETIIPMWPNTFPYSDEEKRVFSQWEKSFKERIIDASIKAYQGSSLAFIRFGTVRVPGLTYNRTHKNGVIDENMAFMLIRNKSSNVALVNFCCHPVCNVDFGISADYPGELYANMLKNGFESFFTTGPAGDIDPIEKGRSFMSKIGSVMESAMRSAMEGSIELTDETINIQNRTIKLRLRDSLPLEEARRRFVEQYELCRNRLEDSTCATKLIYADEEYEVAKEGKTSVETLVQTLTIGSEFAFVSVPGELFVEFGLKIREEARAMGYKSTIISTYSEDYVGYIPDKMAFEKGSYETTPARWSRVTSDAGDQVCQMILNCLKSSKKGL